MNTNSSLQAPWLIHGEMATAMWANWCLLSLQMMHGINRACLTLAVGSCTGGLSLARNFYESDAKGNSTSQG